MLPLDRDQFASALRKGLGRALQHATQHGLDGIADLVLEACIHNQNYDAQCECSRAPWLFLLFGQSPYHARFSDAILGALTTETDTWDLQQLCRLAKEMTARGDMHARQALKQRVLEIAATPGSNEWVGADELIELEGADGVIELARAYGQRLLSNPDDRPHDASQIKDGSGRDLRLALSQHAKDEPAVKAYWDYLERVGYLSHLDRTTEPVDREAAQQRWREKHRQLYTLESTLSDARNGAGEIPGRYTMFGRCATPEELETLYTCMLNETNESTIERLLWVFRRVPLPRLNDTVFRWTTGPSEPLRAASVSALSQVSDQRVHDLAKLKVKTSSLLGPDAEALDLFLHNYEAADASLIARALSSLIPDTDDAHSLGSSIVEIAERYGDPCLADALIWAYENTPCTDCRYKVVVQLDRIQQLDDAVLHECQFDANREISAFAIRLAEQK